MQTRFILIQTSHAGNVGAAARAMRTMGFDDLVLVAPRWANVLRRDETIQRASGALDVLEKARIVDTLDDALDGVTHLCATAMVPRDFGPPTRTPRAHFDALARDGAPQHVAFLFGSERFGMRNEDVYRCHVALSIPAAPDFGSLNLGAAIQVIAYEWRLALGGFPVHDAAAQAEAADAKAVSGMLAHWEHALVEIGFLDPRRAQEADAAPAATVQSRAADAGGDPHPAGHREGDERAAAEEKEEQNPTGRKRRTRDLD